MSSVAPGSSFTNRLLAWYAQNKRSLPWRETHDPYRIWISEVMLQQTQVSTVIPYYLRFVDTFPSLAALADASLDEVMQVWRGLGYYGRARSLHRAAGIICERYRGKFPQSYAELRALPGIGDYTASAVLSIAFGLDYPAIDANARRVICRLYDYAGDPLSPRGKQELGQMAWLLMPPGLAGEFNQSLMELGATLCRAREPQCMQCPLGQDCLANQRGSQKQRPLHKARGAPPERRYVAALIEDSGRILLVRRIPRGLLGGLWELPGDKLQADEDEQSGLRRILLTDLAATVLIGNQCATVRHRYSHFAELLNVYRCTIQGTLVARHQWDSFVWCPLENLGQYPQSRITIKALEEAGYLLTVN